MGQAHPHHYMMVKANIIKFTLFSTSAKLISYPEGREVLVSSVVLAHLFLVFIPGTAFSIIVCIWKSVYSPI